MGAGEAGTSGLLAFRAARARSDLHSFAASRSLDTTGSHGFCRMSVQLVAGIPDGDRVIELLDDLPHRGDSTTIALIVGGRTFRLRLPQQTCLFDLRFGPAFRMSEKVTQSLVVLVVRHDLSLEEGARSCR